MLFSPWDAKLSERLDSAMTPAERYLEGLEMNSEAQSRAGMFRSVLITLAFLVGAWVLWVMRSA